MQITSSDFAHLEAIPQHFGRDYDDVNPALTFSEIPEKTESLALIVEDPDAPSGLFTHWILYNMSPATLQIVQGELPVSCREGRNDYGEDGYGGPKPPSGTHRYIFKLFAVDKMLDFTNENVVDRDALYEAIEDHVIEQAELIGTYSAP